MLKTTILTLLIVTQASASEFINDYNPRDFAPAAKKTTVVKPVEADLRPAVVEQRYRPRSATDGVIQLRAANESKVETETPVVLAAAKPVVEAQDTPDVIVPKPQPIRRVTPGETDFGVYMPSLSTRDEVVAPEVTNDTSEVTNNEESSVIDRIPIPKPKPAHLADNTSREDDSQEDSSEVVSPIPADPPPERLRPRSDEEVTQPQVTAKPALYDVNNCDYRETCWTNRTGDQIKANMKKIISNVAFINQLHGYKFDARYFLCTGWKESTYNPGAVGADGERGMFQVMKDTGAAALKKGGPPKLEEFKNYRTKPETYMTKMAKSTLAQTEMSFMVLKMKAIESKADGVNVDSAFTGNASVETYKKLARRYNGGGSAAVRYSEAIARCMTCLRASDGLPDLSKDFNYSSVDGCLAMAKAR